MDPKTLSLAAINRKYGVASPPAPLRQIPSIHSSARPSTEAPALTAPANTADEPEESDAASSFRLPFDPFRIIDRLWRFAWLILITGGLAGSALFWIGQKRFETLHTASAQLIKQEIPTAFRQSDIGSPFQPREITIPTLMSLMRSATVMERTATRLEQRIPEQVIKSGLTIATERNTDIIHISSTSDQSAPTALATLSAYVHEVLDLTLELQRKDAQDMVEILSTQIQRTDDQLVAIETELLEFGRKEQLINADKQMDAWLGELANFNLKYQGLRLDHETLDLRIAGIQSELAKVDPQASRLITAQRELDQLLVRYTPAHPLVIEAQGRVESIQESLDSQQQRPTATDRPPNPGESAVAESLYLDLVRLRSEKEVLGEQLVKLDSIRTQIDQRLNDLPRKALDYARILSRKQTLETSRSMLLSRQREAELHAEHSAAGFRLLSIAREQDVVSSPPTQKLTVVTAGAFAAGAGLVASILIVLTLADRRVRSPFDLALATDVNVIGSLLADAEGGDDVERWSFRTWNRLQSLLVPAAGGGGRVLGLLDADAHGTGAAHFSALLGTAATQRGLKVIRLHQSEHRPDDALALTDALADPAALLRQLTTQSIITVHTQPGWADNSALLTQWQHAQAIWTRLSGLVLLIEIPAAEQPSALLLAERLPHLVWVARSGISPVETIRETLSTYRDAGCRLVGALLDEAPRLKPAALASRFACGLLLLTASLTSPTATHAAGAPLRLGPGDAVNISLAGFPNQARNDVIVSPDGTLTYLQARSIRAAGLTIDELRRQIATELSQFYRGPRVVITPSTFQSQKAYVLGKIVKKGAVNLYRPLTLVEVVAEAGGLETGLFQQNTVELADLGRSFLMRGDQRMEVDMEALFLRGDTTQNILVEPGDYLYFPSANSNEIYVLGNVSMQGTQGLLAHTSVHSAIAQAGGFAPKAYTSHVLVVRGSLDTPQTFVVDMNALLNGREKGFRLEPKDIVYVADHPWARAEELLHFALSAFTQGAISSWAGANVGPAITAPILPSLR